LTIDLHIEKVLFKDTFTQERKLHILHL